jgi:putative NADH-flavin reductase
MNEPLLLAIIGAAGSLGTILVQKAFSRRKDAVDIQSQIIQDLYKELARLQIQIDELKKDKENSDKREGELLERIEELESENKLQAEQLKQLNTELQNVRNR